MINGDHINEYVLPYFKQPGFFVEIGCWQGKHLSNSLALEQAGWNGICVDPFPYDFTGRKAKLISKAISRDGKPREFVKVYRDRRHGGDVSYFSGFKDSIQVHWPLISEHCDYVHAPTETIRFEDIGAPNPVDFLSVDVEGAEMEILSSIEFSRYNFGMIMFEHNGADTGISQLLVSKGYKLYQSMAIDDIFVKA